MRILVCTNALSIMDGTIFHRLYQPLKDLQECGLKIDFCADFLSQQYSELLKYDVVIVSRTITYNPYFHDQALKYWHNMPKTTKLIVDLDDYWILPEYHPNRIYWAEHKTSQCILDTLRIASQVWTTNKNLAKKINKINPNVEIIANAIKPGDYVKTKSDLTRVGICVNNTHEMNLSMLAVGLSTLDKNKYALHLLGADDSRKSVVQKLLGIDEHKLRYQHYPWIKPTEYHNNYKNLDVMLCPLSANYFNKFRSELKLDEAAAFKFKVIASDFGPYRSNKSPGVETCFQNFDNLDEVLLKLKSQPVPAVTNKWADAQQKRIDCLHEIVYYDSRIN